MLIMTNITNSPSDTERFTDGEDIRAFCREHRLDGLELLPVGVNDPGIIPADRIVGLHLSYYSCWVDYWNGNVAGVTAEFGGTETADRLFGGRQAIVDRYRAQLDFAERLKVKYVVFHVSDVSMRESVSYRLRHSDEKVVAAALELIRAILGNECYSFSFLVENLWWPGFTMTRPEITRSLLDGIEFEKKGVMLDIGHLLHTNLSLRTQREGAEYVHAVLDAHASLASCIRGVHLHQSLCGTTVRRLLREPPALDGSYEENMGQIYRYIFSVDRHRPFTGKGIRQLIDRISPEFLTYEFITRSRAEHALFLRRQSRALALGRE
jgi:sugar phosphate isomerase/epimerase